MSLKVGGGIKKDTKKLNNRDWSKVNKFNESFWYNFRVRVVIEVNLERNIIIVSEVTMEKYREFGFTRM
jgi:hypothetical protein